MLLTQKNSDYINIIIKKYGIVSFVRDMCVYDHHKIKYLLLYVVLTYF